MKRTHVHVLLLLGLLVSGSTFLLAQHHSYAFAEDSTIAIPAQSSTLNYPKSIDVKMSAHDSSGQIQEATLYIQYNQNEIYSEQDRYHSGNGKL